MKLIEGLVSFVGFTLIFGNMSAGWGAELVGTVGATKPETQSGEVIKGIIRDAAGNPGQGVQLTLMVEDATSNSVAISDANGRFELRTDSKAETGIRWLIGRSPDKNLAFAEELFDGMTNLDLRLQTGVKIVGKIEDLKERPVTNGETCVRFFISQLFHDFEVNSFFKIDSQGQFEITALPSIGQFSISITAKGYGSTTRTINPNEWNTNVISLSTIFLQPANFPVAGRVVDANQKSLGGVWVDFGGGGQAPSRIQSDTNGHFSFGTVYDRPVWVRATADQLTGYVRTTAGDTNVILPLDQKVSPSSNRFGPPKLSGIARDPDGKVVPGLHLKIYGSVMGGEAATDRNGRYRIGWQSIGPEIMSDRPSLLVRDEARNLAAAIELLDLEEGTTNLDITLKPGLIFTGKVEDKDGTPLAGANVTVVFWTGNRGLHVDLIKTDTQGHFKTAAWPLAQRYSMNVSLNGFGSENQNPESDPSSNRVEVPTFVLKKADQKISGLVVDSNNEPQVDVIISLNGQGQPFVQVTTDAKGRFVFPSVREGSARLYAYSIFREFNGTDANVRSGDTNVLITVTERSGAAPRISTPASLKGKPLPDLTPLGISTNAMAAGKRLLVCLFDAGQRSSRHSARMLAEQSKPLAEKGVIPVLIQAGEIATQTLEEWKTANPVPFDLGRLVEKTPQTKWISDVKIYPWLILTDTNHVIMAEGFSLEELDNKLK